jgi:hypothetical protein
MSGTLTVTCKDVLGAELPGSVVYLAESTGTYSQAGIADSLGVVVFAGVTNGSYILIAEYGGMLWDVSPQTVSGDASIDLELEDISPSGVTCAVIGILLDAGGVAIEGAVVTATASVPQSGGYLLMGNTAVSATTNSSGVWTMNLTRGSSVFFDCAIAGLNAAKKLIPNDASANFGDLADDPT